MTDRARPTWHILTGEYAPSPGGVADYTRNVARALAASGDEVHVWAPGERGDRSVSAAVERGVVEHRLPGHFDARALRALTRELARFPPGRRLLVQYEPHAYGMNGMNLPFCAWLALRRSDELWVMFHEVAYPWRLGQSMRKGVLALVERAMAALVTARADRVFVAVPFWQPYLRSFLPWSPAVTWLPVPSSLPTSVEPAGVREARKRLVGDDEGALVVGHFGTYGALISPLLAATVRAHPVRPRLRWRMLGRAAAAFVQAQLADRSDVLAAAASDDARLAEEIAACDVLVQPYADGISSRRSSAMAGLALGRPVVTNDGPATEPVWRSGVVALAARPDPALIAAALDRLAGDPGRAASLSSSGRALYKAEFSIEHTVSTLHQSLSSRS